METKILEIQKLSYGYKGHQVLSTIDLSVNQGSIVALAGPSGAGKSTLLRLIAGLIQNQRGSIRIAETLVAQETKCMEPAQRGIGMVFQDGALFPHLNCADNIMFGYRGSRGQRDQRLKELLPLLGLQDLAKRYPHELSGGQQQRVGLARALAKKPKLLLMDEAFAGMDRARKLSLLPELRAVLQAEGISALMVSHDAEEALAMADYLAMMEHGTIIQTGTPEEIAKGPCSRTVSAFLGLPSCIECGDSIDTATGTSTCNHGNRVYSIRSTLKPK